MQLLPTHGHVTRDYSVCHPLSPEVSALDGTFAAIRQRQQSNGGRQHEQPALANPLRDGGSDARGSDAPLEGLGSEWARDRSRLGIRWRSDGDRNGLSGGGCGYSGDSRRTGQSGGCGTATECLIHLGS